MKRREIVNGREAYVLGNMLTEQSSWTLPCTHSNGVHASWGKWAMSGGIVNIK